MRVQRYNFFAKYTRDLPDNYRPYRILFKTIKSIKINKRHTYKKTRRRLSRAGVLLHKTFRVMANKKIESHLKTMQNYCFMRT